ncbi:MAG: acetyltransferase [Methanobrevibacter sp.]|nr:acetyltransferase [Methanobrevibacter sp.]
MEHIEYATQFEMMVDNKIIGMPTLKDSKITFMGKNNVLVCKNNIKLENVVLEFNGSNSIVYVGSDLIDDFRLVIYNNSTGFIGKDCEFGSSVKLHIFENQNLIIGDDCILSDNVFISNSDGYSIYDSNSKERINFSNSVWIGDHVFLGNNVYVSKGVKIGSGSIIGNASFIRSYAKIPSNVHVSGNPAKIIKNDVFFTKDFAGGYTFEDVADSQVYKSNVFIYEVVNKETLSLDDINNILSELDVGSRLDFIQKLFINNKRRNRFSL